MPGTGGVRVDEPYRLRADTIRLSVWAVLAGWILRRLGRLLLALVRSPALLAAIGLTCSTVWVFHLLGPVPVGAAGVVLILIGLGWRWRWPDGFDRHVRLRVRGWRRGTWLYRRLWVSAATSCGLSRDRTNGIIVVPSIVRVRATCSVDRVLVRMLPGQTLDDYATTSPRLAQTFGAQD
ncbi:MAG: hypothetical protein L0H41_04985, partial [Microlunatus sp.]|nr:hypothetical protein [Microlunatus sp.]